MPLQPLRGTRSDAYIDLAIDGHESTEREMALISDFVTPNSQHGIFVFSRGGLLAGVEIYQLAAEQPAPAFTPPLGFTPFPAAQHG